MKSILTYLNDNFIPRDPNKFEVQGSLVDSVETQRNSAGFDDVKKSKSEEGKVEVQYEVIETSDSEREKIGTRRVLKNRHIQLIGIGGTIGTALFVSIGSALSTGGPLSLLMGFSFWCIPILFVTVSCAEMVSYMPISSPFIRMAGEYVDDSLEITAGWNFWFLECALIPFEVTAFNTILHFWTDGYSPAIPLAIQVVLYFFINVIAVQWYGETEFFMAIGKVLLAVGLMFFTFVTMVGGNPKHDVYGFRNWKTPGPMAEYIHTGDLGRFQGLLACIITACFTIAGPEYVSMTAGECVNPRKNLPRAYKQVAYRLTFFFIGGCFCIGTVCAYNDPLLLAAITEGKPGAGSSPYIIAITNLNIKVLPHIVNVLLLTSAFSAGNSYTYCSSRALYGMALDRKAPKIFTYCSKTGVPIYCVLISNCWALLSFLQLGENAVTVLNWIVNLVTSSQLINFFIIAITYIHFFRACQTQGVDRSEFPFTGMFQPYLAYICGFLVFVMVWICGYTVFIPGGWSVQSFLFNYLMIFIDVTIFVVWKLWKRTKYKRPSEVDLSFAMKEIEDYEQWYNENFEA